MRLLFLLLFMSLPFISPSQDSSLVGKIDFKQLYGIPGWENLDKDFATYHPDSLFIQNIMSKSDKIAELTLFLGTWCSDSQEQVPKVWKVLQSLHLDKKIRIYGVNRDKTEPRIELDRFKATKLPSLFVSIKNQEVIQILNEIPEVNFETDFWNKIKVVH